MYARNPKPAVEKGSSSSDLSNWSAARVPFAEVARAKAHVKNARSSQLNIAVGAVSVAAITAAVLNFEYGVPVSDKMTVSSGSEAVATDVRPSLDFGPGPSEEGRYSSDIASQRMGDPTSSRDASWLAGIADNAVVQAAPVTEMPVLAKAGEEPKDLATPSPAGTHVTDRNVNSSSPDGPTLTEPRWPTPKPKAASKAAEKLTVQSQGSGAGEIDTRLPLFPTQSAQLDGLHTKGVGAKPDAPLTQIGGDAKGSNFYFGMTYNLSDTEEMVTTGLVSTGPVPNGTSVDDVLLLDGKLVETTIALIRPTTGATAAEEIEFIPTALDTEVVSNSATIGASSFEIPNETRPDVENARQLATRRDSGALDESASLARADAPAAEVAELVQDPSRVEIAAAFPGPSAQGASVELLPATMATQAWVGDTAVGSLPVQISPDALVSVRLADLISLFEDRMERPLYVWLKSSSSANEYVTFDTLKSAGIDAQYDAGTRQVALSIADDRAP